MDWFHGYSKLKVKDSAGQLLHLYSQCKKSNLIQFVNAQRNLSRYSLRFYLAGMNESGHRYFILNKPFNMVSQFVSPDKVRLLKHLDFIFPEGTHAVGRLDNHSEGLLILTTNKRVTKLLFQGEKPHKRTYLVRVKNVVTETALERLRNGVEISASGEGNTYVTEPCEVEIVPKPNNLHEGEYEFREDLPHTWLSITLTEGKFHQVRKMVAEVNHRCKRLIRTSIEDIELGDLQPGEILEMKEEDFFKGLRIANYDKPMYY